MNPQRMNCRSVLIASGTLVALLSGSIGHASGEDSVGDQTEPVEILAPDGTPTGLVLPPEQREAGKRNEASLAKRGFVEMLDEPRRVDAVMAKMEERRVAARKRGKEGDPDELGFMEFTRDQYVAFSKAPYNPATLDPKYLTAETKSYLLMGSPMITQLHSNTQFGSLLIEEYPNTKSSDTTPNTWIAGQPATMAHIKYSGDAWASALYVQHGSSFFVFETDKKVRENSVPRFLEMAESLIQESAKRP